MNRGGHIERSAAIWLTIPDPQAGAIRDWDDRHWIWYSPTTRSRVQLGGSTTRAMRINTKQGRLWLAGPQDQLFPHYGSRRQTLRTRPRTRPGANHGLLCNFSVPWVFEQFRILEKGPLKQDNIRNLLPCFAESGAPFQFTHGEELARTRERGGTFALAWGTWSAWGTRSARAWVRQYPCSSSAGLAEAGACQRGRTGRPSDSTSRTGTCLPGTGRIGDVPLAAGPPHPSTRRSPDPGNAPCCRARALAPASAPTWARLSGCQLAGASALPWLAAVSWLAGALDTALAETVR